MSKGPFSRTREMLRRQVGALRRRVLRFRFLRGAWWDGGETSGEAENAATGDISRDYFIALSSDARWLWIYRDCRAPGGWFLQGFFA